MIPAGLGRSRLALASTICLSDPSSYFSSLTFTFTITGIICGQMERMIAR